MYCNVKGFLKYILAAVQMWKLPLSFLFPWPALYVIGSSAPIPYEFSCYSCGIWMDSDIGVHVIFVCSIFFFFSYIYIYIIIYIYTYACVYTFERLCWLPGGVFLFFFSFPKWNLVVVEKASRFLLCAHFLHSFVFAATHIVDQAFI